MKVSVVTVCYNAVQTLEKTILSVLSQPYPDVEYIIIDGGSTDGTVDIIKKYAGRLAYWVSEPDKGIYDAMNKGTLIASGDWVIYINADDVLLSLPIETLQIEKVHSYYSAICGEVKTECGIIKPVFNWSIFTHNTLPHQGIFYNQRLRYGLFDLKYKVFADYAFNIDLYKKGAKVLCIDEIIAFHSLDGISNNKKYVKELFSIIRSNGLCAYCLSLLYFKYKGVSVRVKKLMYD